MQSQRFKRTNPIAKSWIIQTKLIVQLIEYSLIKQIYPNDYRKIFNEDCWVYILYDIKHFITGN
jgi:hypothetical protein